MNDVTQQIKFFVNSVWQRRFYALAVAWFVCLAGWVVVATMPNVYRSSARIFIDTSNILRPLLKGLTVETDLNAALELMKRTLTSRASLSTVARLTDLDLTASTPYEMETLLDSLKSRIKIKSERSNLMTISFMDSDPVRARDVTQALITTFVELNLGHGREDMESARQFLDSQIAEYERQLRQAEQRLANFKQDKLRKLPNQAIAQGRIQTLGNERLVAEAALRRATSRRDLLRQQLDAGPGNIRGPLIEKLEESLSDLLSRYTEKHPEVIAVRRSIEAYRKGHESDPETTLAEVSGGTTQTPLSSDGPRRTSPALKQVEIDLAQQEADIAFYKERIPRIVSRIDELKRAVAQIPEVEAERTRLNRDYAVLISKNNQLIDRREKAWISQERELRTDIVKFRILEPPRVPGSPTGPSRSLLLTVSLFGGIGAGIVFALLLGLLSNAVSDLEQLREWFGLPILGTVSIIDNFRHHSLRVAQSSAFFACLALLFVVFAGLLEIERQSGLASLASNSHVNAAFEEVRAAPGRLKSVIADVIGRI